MPPAFWTPLLSLCIRKTVSEIMMATQKTNTEALLRDALPSSKGAAARLGTGLTVVGDAACAGVVEQSIGTVPVCGEDMEEDPGSAPILFCLGERGLCAIKTVNFTVKITFSIKNPDNDYKQLNQGFKI